MENLSQLLAEAARKAVQGNPTDFHLAIWPDPNFDSEKDSPLIAGVNMCGDLSFSLPIPSGDRDKLTLFVESSVTWLIRLVKRILPPNVSRYCFVWACCSPAWTDGMSTEDVAAAAQSAVNISSAFPYIIRTTVIDRKGEEVKFHFVSVNGGRRVKDKQVILGEGQVLQSVGGSPR